MIQVGDRVIAFCDYNAWAEAVAVPAQFVYKMPEAMTFQDGAAFFMNYVVAYVLLFDIGAIKAGQSVLIHSAGGGVVSFYLFIYLFIFIFYLFIFLKIV